MRKAFDQVLTRNPDYQKRDELALAYLEYAQKTAAKSAANAIAALGRAERLGQGSEIEKTATSLRLTLEAEELAASGIADRTLLTRALEVNPNNQRAQSELFRFEHGEIKQDDSFRYFGAGAIFVVALAGIAFVLLRRGAPEAALAAGAPESVASTEEADTDAGTEGPTDTKVKEPAPPEGEASSRTTLETEQ